VLIEIFINELKTYSETHLEQKFGHLIISKVNITATIALHICIIMCILVSWDILKAKAPP
jgi:hypothetical protein